MAKIECEIELEDVSDGFGSQQPVVKAICSRCGYETMSFGTSDKSVRRCLALMREECPKDERNFYVDSEED